MDLRGCPFCGSPAEAAVNLPPYRRAFGVRCPNERCLISPWTRWHPSPEAAAALWNERPQIMISLSDAQQTCGNVIDRLPCLRCGATSLKDCTLSMAERSAATSVINSTPGLMNQLLAKRDAMAIAQRPSNK